ncbi:MAG: cadherin-like domain-containing protein, partial [Planctomycetes bacterium]|nr:cadherin-like domain-containing protein [Planctomycetota bacterium]
MHAGTNQTLSVSFTPTDTTDFTSATGTALINVLKATPQITWTNPAAITYGTALSSTQLDATASVPGTFTYTPPAGTVLKVGTGQILSEHFVPADSTDFMTPADQTVTLTVISSGDTLREGNSFNTTVQHTFTVPQQASTLSLSFEPSFDTTVANAPKDAFEAALVASDGTPLVHTFAPNRDAFFNLTEGQQAQLGAGTIFDGHTVTVNLAGLPPGSQATLVYRLVNNDASGGSSVHIDPFTIQATNAGPVAAVPQVQPGRSIRVIDFPLLSDVSASFTPQYGQTSFDRDTQTFYTDVALDNAGTYSVGTPLVLAVNHLSDPTVHVVNADGTTPDGLPYFDFSGGISGGRLDPGGITGTRTLAFLNPNQVQFTFDLEVLSQLNRPPAFTSKPQTEAIPGVPYVYQATAADPDGDPLTFSVVNGPPGLAIDPATGKVTWAPQANDLGNHAVTLGVEDGHGASAQQTYSIGVIQAPPNQPPVFTSTPVVDATVNTPYSYQATAADPDGDHPLNFSLIAGPKGLTIDPVTGQVQWTPTADQLAATGQAPSNQDPTLPSVSGYLVSNYATITNPAGQPFETNPLSMAFDPAGTLYVGMDNIYPGPPVTPSPDLAHILRIGNGGIVVENYGNALLPDPNNVLFDPTGSLSRTAGSVIVNGSDGSGNGIFSAILP